MAKRTQARKTRKGLFSKLYRPISEVIGAANNVSHTVTQSVDKIMHTGLQGANKIGKNVTGRVDKVIYNVMPRKTKKSKRRRS
jgi:hypothetical protein